MTASYEAAIAAVERASIIADLCTHTVHKSAMMVAAPLRPPSVGSRARAELLRYSPSSSRSAASITTWSSGLNGAMWPQSVSIRCTRAFGIFDAS